MKKTNILRLIALIMCIPFAFSLVSCGDTEKQTTATTQTTSTTAPVIVPTPAEYSKIGFVIYETLATKLATFAKNDEEMLAKWNECLVVAKEMDEIFKRPGVTPSRASGHVHVVFDTAVDAGTVKGEIEKAENFKYTSVAYQSENRVVYEVKYEDIDFEAIKKFTLSDKIGMIYIFVTQFYMHDA